MKYTELPPGHSWNNPENADAPPDGWRFPLKKEAGSNAFAGTQVKCRLWLSNGWDDDDDPAVTLNSLWSYIVPDTTPFDIPSSANRIPDDSSPVVGIPLRAYFAGLAMQGLISRIPEGKQGTTELIADLSVQCADALIAALEGKEEA